MHALSESGATVPAFLAKLWKLVEDPETDNLICWSQNGKSFVIKNQARFARELLPHYYKHNNMASFVRQLNMYGFHKKVSVELGGLKCDKDEMEFAHQFFSKGNPFLIGHIKRKIASNKNQESVHSPCKPEIINKVLTEVRNMKNRQETLEAKLISMKNENQTLWRELILLGQKNLKQQQMVNQLITVLYNIIQPSSRGGLPVKRRYPLMINDSRPKRSKLNKLQKPQASTGPVIHELDASEFDLDSEYNASEMLENKSPAVHSPQEHAEVLVDHEDTENLVDPLGLNDDIQFVDPYQLVERKHTGKSKKNLNIARRKKKVPIKILIPPLEKGEKPREEMHLLEIPVDEQPVTLLNNKSNSKPVPVATMRSSKLAAMAANMTKVEDIDDDDEVPSDTDENIEFNDASMKLENILTLEKFQQIHDNVEAERDEFNKVYKKLNQINEKEKKRGISILAGNGSKQYNEDGTLKPSLEEKYNNMRASTSRSKDLSLSCVNFPDISEANYREEIDNLETMQNNVDVLQDILVTENYSIDANTLLGLFGTDDPMTFGLPINPELNPELIPDCEKDDDHFPDSVNGPAGGELITYNPPSNLLDELDNVFSLSPASPDLPTNSLYPDLELDDNKTLLCESVPTNTNSRS